MKHCPKCGEKLEDGVKFCNNCGTAVGPSGGLPGGGGIQSQNRRSGGIFKLIIGVILAVFLVAGGLWGWKSYGTGAQVEQKLDLAVKYLSDNDYEQAILAFNDVIKIAPKEVKAYQGLARTYTLQGKFDEAQTAYDQGIGAVAQDKKQILQLGLAGMYIDKNDLNAAAQAFEGIKNNSENCLEAYWGLAMVYQQQGDNSKAESMLKQAVAKNLNDYRGYNTLALFLKQNNKTDEAFDNIVKSLGLEINQQEAYVVLSDLYKGRWNDLQGKLPTVTNQTAGAMLEFYGSYASGNNVQALGIYNSKISNQSGNQKAQILAAIAMVKNGDKTGAEALIQKISKAKLNEWLLSDIAQYYQTAGDTGNARVWALKALEANPINLEAIALLQNINADEANVKIYSAQTLLYNWKPVNKVKEELQALNNQANANLPSTVKKQDDSKATDDKAAVDKNSSPPNIENGPIGTKLKPISLEVKEDNELWVKYSDGHKELLVSNLIQGYIDNPQFSLDGTKVYFCANNGTLASCSTYAVNIKDKVVKRITFGNFIRVINDGEYKGNIIVSKHGYNGPPNYGSYDQECVVDANGNTLAKLN